MLPHCFSKRQRECLLFKIGFQWCPSRSSVMSSSASSVRGTVLFSLISPGHLASIFLTPFSPRAASCAGRKQRSEMVMPKMSELYNGQGETFTKLKIEVGRAVQPGWFLPFPSFCSSWPSCHTFLTSIAPAGLPTKTLICILILHDSFFSY